MAFTVDDPVKVGWAGGMWLDSELRVRAYEQCTYFVVRSVDGVMRDCEFLFWDLYNGAGDESEREYAWSEIQRTWRKLEMEAFINAMPNNGFVSSFYENVWEADLSQLIYQCVDESVTYESVREAYKAEVGDVHTDLSYISRDNLNKLLLSLTGYGLDDKDWNFGGTRYLASIDVYCVMHGDTYYDPFVCTGIDTDSELFTAVLRRKLADELSGEYLRVTLRDTGSGTYQFVSCQPLP